MVVIAQNPLSGGFGRTSLTRRKPTGFAALTQPLVNRRSQFGTAAGPGVRPISVQNAQGQSTTIRPPMPSRVPIGPGLRPPISSFKDRLGGLRKRLPGAMQGPGGGLFGTRPTPIQPTDMGGGVVATGPSTIITERAGPGGLVPGAAGPGGGGTIGRIREGIASGGLVPRDIGAAAGPAAGQAAGPGGQSPLDVLFGEATRQLDEPDVFGSELFQGSLEEGRRGLEEEFGRRRKSLEANLASRGLDFGSTAGGALSDLEVEQGRGFQDVLRPLLRERAGAMGSAREAAFRNLAGVTGLEEDIRGGRERSFQDMLRLGLGAGQFGTAGLGDIAGLREDQLAEIIGMLTGGG